MTQKLTRISRLKQFAKERRIAGPVQLGIAVGRKSNQVSDLLAGRAPFGEKIARSIEASAGLPIGWLDLEDDTTEVPSLPTVADDGGGIAVPLLAVAGSMGPGTEQMPEEVVVGKLTLSPVWISTRIKPLTNPMNLRFIHGYGDSMEPTFFDGDVLLVDTGVRTADIDGVYVLAANDRLYIKRVRQTLKGSFEVSSDNPIVKTIDVLSGSRDVEILGRVVWLWNGRKI
ncbi:MAG: helix-turn-helix transcriptional regulator [Alcaligenaceae bacterium]|nr:MAG: helix-turn-helix transcriptional regulator [Alcaligenaceae bacterium]